MLSCLPREVIGLTKNEKEPIRIVVVMIMNKKNNAHVGATWLGKVVLWMAMIVMVIMMILIRMIMLITMVKD